MGAISQLGDLLGWQDPALCPFPRWGCAKGRGRGALGGEALKICNCFQKKNCALPAGPWTWAEAGGVPAPFSCCHRERRWCVNCLLGREWCQHLDNMEFLVVYVHFRSSAYIQKIAVYLALLSGLEFSGSWNAFLTLLFFLYMLIYSLRSVSPVMVECMQLPPWSAEKFGLLCDLQQQQKLF